MNKFRTIVRLGEHDTTTESDGLHQDLKVEKFFMHRHYDSFDKLNDIAILSLERDVEFTGKTIGLFDSPHRL